MSFGDTKIFHGMGVAEGVAIGNAVCLNNRIGDIYQIPVGEGDIDQEIARFREAVEKTQEGMRDLGSRVEAEIGEDLIGILDAQVLILGDRAFLDRVERRIRDERVNAEWALQETVAEIQAQFAAIATPHLRERAEDLRHVCRSVVRSLRGINLHDLSEIQSDVVIVADDLAPADTVRLGRENVVGFVIEHGSRTSHTSIIARSLNIPAVLGVQGLSTSLAEKVEIPVIVDGTEGRVIVSPDRATLDEYRRRLALQAEEEIALQEAGELSAITRDGVQIEVMANIDLPEELHEARKFGAAGIGLYRSEFLYIERSPEMPSEEDHVEVYRQIIEAAAPHPAIIRTYDLGGRKIAREMMESHEENPVLGLRGIRLTLARREIFKTQVRALLRATALGDLWIMLPMVTILEEVHEFKRFAEEVMIELEAEGLPFRRDYKLGIMIEVPAAALISDQLAREVDFFSIGTNDLIQYALAVDRNNEHVADLYRPLHPGLVRLLRQVIQNANEAGIEVSLCGEMGSDPKLTPILLGCGLRRMSVSPRQVPMIKQRIRQLSADQLADVVDTCCQLATAREIDDYLLQVVESAS